jgi:hypothetical protein
VLNSSAITDDSGSSSAENTDVDLAALRAHKRSVEIDFLNEVRNAFSTAITHKELDSDGSDSSPVPPCKRPFPCQMVDALRCTSDDSDISLAPRGKEYLTHRRTYVESEVPLSSNEGDVHLPARHERFVARWDGGLSESCTSDGVNEIYVVTDISGEDANNSFVASDGDADGSDANYGSVEEPIELSSDDGSV